MEKVSNYEVAKEVGKNIGKGTLMPFKAVYAFPTFANELNKLDKCDWDYRMILSTIFTGTVALPVLSGMTTVAILNPQGFKPNYFFAGAGVCLATNAIFGVMEIYRHTKKQIQNKKGLEKSVDDLDVLKA